MTDDARIERLTALARKAWPKAAITVYDDSAHVHSTPGDEGTAKSYGFIEHPRALDALEAALETLADEVHLADGSDGKSAHPKTLSECWRLIEAMDRELLEAHENELRLSRELAKPQPWAVDLAAKWQRECIDEKLVPCEAREMADMLRDELLAAAKARKP
jgi:hypothetical protein